MAEQDSVPRDGLLAWADDDYVVAQQLITLTGLYGPDMEEAVAIGSIAQDHLGFAINIYRELEQDDREIDRLVYEREPHDFQCCALAAAWEPEDWWWIVARQLTYDVGNLARQRWAEQNSPSLAGLARLMQRETLLHIEHWSEWWRLAATSDTLREPFEATVRDVAPLLDSFFATTFEPSWSACSVAAREDLARISTDAGVGETVKTLLTEPPPDTGHPGRPNASTGLRSLLDTAHATYRTNPGWNWGV